MRERGNGKKFHFSTGVLYECFPMMTVVCPLTEHLLCAPNCAKWFMCIISFNPPLNSDVDTEVAILHTVT